MKALLGILILLPMLCMGQENLVPNGGFENLTTCPHNGPNGGDVWLAEPWNNIVDIGGGADIYNACAELLISGVDTIYVYNVPENDRGYQHPHSGNGYAGFYAVSDPESYPNFHEFIQTPLTEPLHVGVRYEVVFYVSLADKFQYAVGSLGAHFSVNPLSEAAYDILPDVVPQIQSPVGVIYNDKENWMEIRDTLVIRGGEDGQQWMTIGNFSPDSLSQITFVDSGAGYGYNRSSYYIDDVSVIALDSVPSGVGITEQEALGFDVWPNPATEILNIQSTQRLEYFRVLDMRGREVRTGAVTGRAGIIDLRGMPAGLYLVEIRSTEGHKALQRIVKKDTP